MSGMTCCGRCGAAVFNSENTWWQTATGGRSPGGTCATWSGRGRCTGWRQHGLGLERTSDNRSDFAGSIMPGGDVRRPWARRVGPDAPGPRWWPAGRSGRVGSLLPVLQCGTELHVRVNTAYQRLTLMGRR